jgi:PAS domain S-box-containing protein
MPDPALDDMGQQLRAEINRQLVQRVRLGLTIVVGGILLFAAMDLRFASVSLARLYSLKVVGLALVAIAYAALRRPNIAAHAAIVGWVVLATAFAMNAISGIATGESAGIAILCVSATLITATLFPWGTYPQLATVAAATAALGGNVYWVHGSLDPALTYGGAAALVALALSVGLAYELQRHRVSLMRENLERKRAEKQLMALNETLERRVLERTAELRRSESALASLFESSDDAIWSIDRTYRIVALNSTVGRNFHQLFGADLEIGSSVDDHVPVEIREYWRRLYDRALAGERFVVEDAFTLNGALRHYLISLNPITDAGTVMGATVFTKDITDLKLAAEQARQHQVELTHAQRLSTVGEMAASLAHEINQPLGAIANYAQGCRRRIQQSDTVNLAELAQAIDQIAEEALRAGEVLRRLRRLVRKESAPHEVLDVNEAVLGAVRIMQSAAQLRGDVIRLAMAPELPRVNGDSIQIEQVVLNLLLNATEALELVPNEERDLTVQTSLVEGTAIEVAVRDTGMGLAPAIADKVFDPFFTTKPNGLGMGLAVSRSIIEAHGGRLWVTRNADRGSTFRFTLPLT